MAAKPPERAPRTEAAPEQQVSYFRVEPAAYQAVVRVLGQLPYGQVASTIRALEDGTRAVSSDHVRELSTIEERLAELQDAVYAALDRLGTDPLDEQAITTLNRALAASGCETRDYPGSEPGPAGTEPVANAKETEHHA